MIRFGKWAFISLWSVLCAVLFGPWMTAWLQDYGIFDDPNQQVAGLLERLVALKSFFDQASISPWLVAVLAGTIGFYAGFFVRGRLGVSSGRTQPNSKWLLGEAQSQTDYGVATPVAIPTEVTKPNPRRFINVTPGYLVGLCKGLTGAQAAKLVDSYKGKWVTATARVADVSVEPSFGYVLLQGKTEDGALVSFKFSIANATNVDLMPQGHEVTVEGKIVKIDSWSLGLEHCELVSDRTPVDLPQEQTNPQ